MQVAAKVPYIVVQGTPFYQRAEIKDMIAHLQLVANPRNDLALSRLLGKYVDGLGERTIQLLQNWAADQDKQVAQAIFGDLSSYQVCTSNQLERVRHCMLCVMSYYVRGLSRGRRRFAPRKSCACTW